MTSQADFLNAFNSLILPSISKVQRLFSIILESKIRPLNLTLAEFRIVGLLMGEEQGFSQKQLAQKLSISSPSLSVSIASLEKKQWLQRINDEHDMRVKRVRIHPGADFAGIANLISLLEGQATKGISKKDLQITQKVLIKMMTNYQQTKNNGEII
ncbi:MAG: MarR family transcriptional regulator [Bermanella sp.]